MNEEENKDVRNKEQVKEKKEQVNERHVLKPLDSDEEEALADALKNMIFLEMDIEKSKQKLALKGDFNLLDAFRLFDKYGLGDITKLDFEEGLKTLGIYSIMKKEIDLFFKRYDSNGDHKLRFLEFSDAFTPQDKIYGDHLANKRPNYAAKSSEDAFTLKTKLEFGDTLRVMLKAEAYTEELRANLNSHARFSISAAF